MGASRVLGLAREVLAASYFGLSGAMSAFTIAYQIPNLLRALFADAALQGAFIPVFSDLLERGKRREAMEVAATLAILIVIVLTTITAVFAIAAPLITSVVVPGFANDAHLESLTTDLARIMFPTVILFSLSGLVAGILNSVDHFHSPAFAPVLWNMVVIVALAGFVPLLPADHKIYAYAVGVLIATAVQFMYPLPWLKRHGPTLRLAFKPRLPGVKRVLALMLPVMLTLGLFNFSLFVNSILGTLVSAQAPAAIDRAFRIVVLPQGVFSLAISTVLFPVLARAVARSDWSSLREATAGGIRQICLLTIPSAVLLAVLATPVTRLIYQRGVFDAADTKLVASALTIWAISLPLQGTGTLLSQAFFSLQRPWVTTAIAGAYVAVNAGVGLALYKPLGLEGIVIGTVVANLGMVIGKVILLRGAIGGLDGTRTLSALARMLIAVIAAGLAANAVSRGLNSMIGHAGLVEQATGVGAAVAVAVAVYAAGVLLLRVEEAHQLKRALSSIIRPRHA
jgi:putative peptidoglycan lipid II flippase